MSPEFLEAEDVVEIHHQQIELFGGLDGIRDLALLDSALAQPMAAFGGQFLHEDLFAMATAYLFHIVSHHPFIDGNKRTALIAGLTFLGINEHLIDRSSPLLDDATKADSTRPGLPTFSVPL
jgi:death on curing protein